MTALVGPKLLRERSHLAVLDRAGGVGRVLVACCCCRSCRPASRAMRARPSSPPGYQWIDVGGIDVRVDLRADAMTAIMLSMVTFVSLLVAIFAAGYMHGDPGYPRFFACISLFVFSMCMLVLAGNFLLLFVFWEGGRACAAIC